MFFSLVLTQKPFRATRKWLVEKYSMNVCVEWTQLAHNRVQWQTSVKTAMNPSKTTKAAKRIYQISTNILHWRFQNFLPLILRKN
jgi:hypothetical protein